MINASTAKADFEVKTYMTRTLFLHLGHGKTGSSFLQSSLALSKDRLADLDISYPVHAKEQKKAVAGRVNMGNFPPQLKAQHTPEAFRELVRDENWDGKSSLLLSNEALINSIVKHGFVDPILELPDDIRIRCLLFIRDPLDHALSAHQQRLKAGNTQTISEFLPNYGVPNVVKKLMDILEPTRVELTVRNYSRHKSSMKSLMENWLGIPEGTLLSPPHRTVNRSLTMAEAELQLAFNNHFQVPTRPFVSDALSNELPDIKADRPYIEDAALEQFLDRMKQQTDAVNRGLDKTEWYRVPTLEDARNKLPSEEDASKLHLSREQINVLVQNLATLFNTKRG